MTCYGLGNIGTGFLGNIMLPVTWTGTLIADDISLQKPLQ